MRSRRQFDRGLLVDTDRIVGLEFDSERTSRRGGASSHKTNIRASANIAPGDGGVHARAVISPLRIMLSLSLLGAIFVIACTWVFRVSTINVKLVGAGNSATTSQIVKTYGTEVSRLNKAVFWGLTPTLMSSRISDDFITGHPEVQSVITKRPFPGKSLNVEISPRQPVLVWQTFRGNRYFVDKLGNVFAKNYSEKATASLPLVIDRTMVTIPASNKAPVSQEAIDYIVEFDSAIAAKLPKSKQIESFNLSIAPNGLDVKLAGVKYVVRLQSTGDVGQDSEMLRRSLKYFDNNRSLTPNKYLDLRLVGRGYYQ